MPAAAIATLVIAGLLAAALAVVLSWVVVLLWRIDGALGDVHGRLDRVAEQTAPLSELVTAVNGDLRTIADGLADLARQAAGRGAVR